MSAPDSDRLGGVTPDPTLPTNPDAAEGAATTTVAQSLREVADWLEAHPDVRPDYAFVPIHASDRADLERLAAALGDRAVEKLRDWGTPQVEVEGRFGEKGYVRVYAQVDLSTLAGAPVLPEYTPIIAAD